MFCTRCGARLPDNARFCAGCGAPINAPAGPGAASYPPVPPVSPVPPVPPQPVVVNVVNQTNTVSSRVSYKNKLVALVLCILLGEIGAHRFYVGKIGTGLLWLITGGFFGIGWIIDIISIATGNFTDETGYYLR